MIKYGFIDDKDVMFSKMIWETIDLDQKVNFPYLYPIEFDAVGDERRPLLYFIREARLYQVAPISTNLILSYIAEHVLGMPRSY